MLQSVWSNNPTYCSCFLFWRCIPQLSSIDEFNDAFIHNVQHVIWHLKHALFKVPQKKYLKIAKNRFCPLGSTILNKIIEWLMRLNKTPAFFSSLWALWNPARICNLEFSILHCIIIVSQIILKSVKKPFGFLLLLQNDSGSWIFQINLWKGGGLQSFKYLIMLPEDSSFYCAEYIKPAKWQSSLKSTMFGALEIRQIGCNVFDEASQTPLNLTMIKMVKSKHFFIFCFVLK